MNPDQLVSELAAAKKGNSLLDVQVAEALGRSKSGGVTPNYTSDMQAAYQLHQQVAPQSAVALVLIDGRATAVIEGGVGCEASTAPLALCLALLKEKIFTDIISVQI